MSRTNYIFIDFENDPESDLERIRNKPAKVRFFLGQRNKNLPVKLVNLLLSFPDQVKLIQTQLDGKNALDFVLACEIGVESEKDPLGYFHILSRDKGFDALVNHLKEKGILAARHSAFSEIPLLMKVSERVKFLAAYFKANHSNRPGKRKTLESQINALFGKALLPEDVADTIQALLRERIISLSKDGGIAYRT